MNSDKSKALVLTLALVIFLAAIIYKRVDWIGLMIPGAILMWYGWVGSTLWNKAGPHHRKRSSVN